MLSIIASCAAGRAWKSAFGDFAAVGSDAVAHAALLQLPLEVRLADADIAAS